MSISRRGFFGLLSAGAALVAAPELAERLVPKRTIFLPPKGGWNSRNQLLTVKMIHEEAMRVLSQNLEFMAVIERGYAPFSLNVSDDGGKTFTAYDESKRLCRISITRPSSYDLRIGDRIPSPKLFS